MIIHIIAKPQLKKSDKKEALQVRSNSFFRLKPHSYLVNSSTTPRAIKSFEPRSRPLIFLEPRLGLLNLLSLAPDH